MTVEGATDDVVDFTTEGLLNRDARVLILNTDSSFVKDTCGSSGDLFLRRLPDAMTEEGATDDTVLIIFIFSNIL